MNCPTRLCRLVTALALAVLVPVVAAQEAPPAQVAGHGAGEGADASAIDVKHPERFPTAKVAVKQLARQLVTNGVVSWDVSRAVPINALGGGRALEVKVRLGDDVVGNQLLLLIDSPDLSQALADYRKALSTTRLAQKAYARAKLLFDHEGVAQKDVEQAEDDRNRAVIDCTAAAERIRLLGGRADQVSPLIEVRTPIGGTIVEQNVQRGAAIKSVENAPNLFTVADLSRVWVLCDLYEENLSDVKVGDEADITLYAYPTRPLVARVVQVGRVLDPATRTAKVRLELDNPDGILRMGMFAKVKFQSSQMRAEASVPAGAVLVLHDRSYVFRRESEHRFRQTAVEPGRSLGAGQQEILSGLSAGDEVVMDATAFANTAAAEDAR